MSIAAQVEALPKSTILDLIKNLNGGTIGFDHERVKKAECAERLMAFGEQRVSALINGDTAAAAAPVVEKVIAVGGVQSVAAPVTAVDQNAIASQIAGLFATLAGSAVNEQRVREIVAGEVEAALERSPVVTIEVKRADGTTHTVEGHTRPEFADVLTAASVGLNVLLVGPAGCGKTHLAHQVATALGRQFASISCTAGMSESALMGWMLPGPGGEFVYVPSDFVTVYEQGGVFLFDEIDAADSNTLLFVNQALANGSFYLPQRKGATKVTRHPDFVCIAAANTYGTGSNMVYAGRERLDESTLDRFRAGTIELGYDQKLERAAVDPEVLAWGWAVRKRISEARLSRVLSTRFLLDATKLVKAGRTLDQIKATYYTGWKADERAKVEV
jgi:cobaltochelatase CobS